MQHGRSDSTLKEHHMEAINNSPIDWFEIPVRDVDRAQAFYRIERLDVLTERFRDEPGKTLPDLLRQVEAGRRER